MSRSTTHRPVDVVPEVPLRASEVHVSCGTLYDLVILAGGSGSKLAPLCNETSKPMLPIGGKPLIWYVIKPWVDRGARTIFFCSQDFALTSASPFLEDVFPHVTFRFVTVPEYHVRTDENGSNSNSNEDEETSDALAIPSTSCDAVREYLEVKKSLRREGSADGQPRDALIVSGDTILAKFDMEPFIRNFYASGVSAAAAFWRPEASSAKPDDGGAKSKAKPGNKSTASDGLKPWQNHFTCIAYEEEDAPTEAAEFHFGSQGGKAGASPIVENHRLHFMCSLEDDPQPSISLGFAARRPNLTFVADVVDAHVYLLRRWVLDFIVSVAPSHPQVNDIPTLRADILPLLARSQHTIVNKEHGVFLTPADRLKLEKMRDAFVGADWAIDPSTTRSIGWLNASNTHSTQPAVCLDADRLRVHCTIFNENQALHPQVMRRVNTKEAYLAIHHEAVRILPAPNKEPVPPTTMGLAALEASAAEHDAALSKCPNASHRVVQSIVRSPPHLEAFITRSVIGQRVTLGKNCRITNSVVADNVELQNNTTIVNSVLSVGVCVREGVTITNCFVAPQEQVGSDESDCTVVTAS